MRSQSHVHGTLPGSGYRHSLADGRSFDGVVAHRIDGGVVTWLTFLTENVTDISPVRALPGLRHLNCGGYTGKGRLADLTPLKDMKLTYLDCYRTQVSDLSPLKDLPLTVLGCGETQVSDLTPL